MYGGLCDGLCVILVTAYGLNGMMMKGIAIGSCFE